jgi:hypothetical protein
MIKKLPYTRGRKKETRDKSLGEGQKVSGIARLTIKLMNFVFPAAAAATMYAAAATMYKARIENRR